MKNLKTNRILNKHGALQILGLCAQVTYLPTQLASGLGVEGEGAENETQGSQDPAPFSPFLNN